jgi:hypothetical protein
MRGLAMGRGRQKAKNTKVARELKYFSPRTDYSALEAELGSKAAEHGEDFEDRWQGMYPDAEEPADADNRRVDLDDSER